MGDKCYSGVPDDLEGVESKVPARSAPAQELGGFLYFQLQLPGCRDGRFSRGVPSGTSFGFVLPMGTEPGGV